MTSYSIPGAAYVFEMFCSLRIHIEYWRIVQRKSDVCQDVCNQSGVCFLI